MINFFIKDTQKKQEIEFLLKIWARNSETQIQFVENSSNAIAIGRHSTDTLHISEYFASPTVTDLKLNSYGVLTGTFGKPDYIATAFHMLNSIQEYHDKNPDALGRFRFTSSAQHRFGMAKKNIVQHCFDEISKIVGITPPNKKSRFFLTHDIDSVNGAILEDGFNVIKKGRLDLFLSMLFRVAVGRPDWLNIDKILKLESEYDCRSVFYWIVNHGRINKREINADYNLQSSKIQPYFEMVSAKGSENGLHKSISKETFREELDKFGNSPLGNRYHYLKFSLPQAYHDIEEAGLKLDASLGFAEEIGFRNNYGLPFNPYNFTTRKPFSFVEVPLHVMDRTFFQYKKMNTQEAEKEIIDFFEKNKQNCVLSVLWHNNFFTNYKFKGYLDLYKKILAYIKENNLNTISQQEIIANYSIV